MSYNKQVWEKYNKDLPREDQPNAITSDDRLNHIESGIFYNSTELELLKNELDKGLSDLEIASKQFLSAISKEDGISKDSELYLARVDSKGYIHKNIDQRFRAEINYINDNIKYSIPVYGKSIGIVGDHLLKGNVDFGWFQKMKKELKCLIFNLSTLDKSVSTFSTNNLINSINDVPLGLDYIVFNGGSVDCNNSVDLGIITEKYDDNFDTSTYCGALEKVCMFLYKKYPYTKKGYISQYKPVDDNGELKEDYIKYYEASKLICSKWGVPYLDIWNEFGIHMQLNKSIFVDSSEMLTKQSYDFTFNRVLQWMNSL